MVQQQLISGLEVFTIKIAIPWENKQHFQLDKQFPFCRSFCRQSKMTSICQHDPSRNKKAGRQCLSREEYQKQKYKTYNAHMLINRPCPIGKETAPHDNIPGTNSRIRNIDYIDHIRNSSKIEPYYR